MGKKEAYIEKWQAQLNEWKADLDKWKAKADQAKADTKIDLYQKIEEAELQIKKLQRAGEDAWDRTKKGAERAWEDLRDFFHKAS